MAVNFTLLGSPFIPPLLGVVVKQGSSYILRASGGINTGKIPSQNEIRVAQGRGIPAYIQMAENRLTFILFGHVMVILQHGEHQGLAESAGTDKELKFRLFKQRNFICPIAIKMPLGVDLSKIAYTVRKF